MELQEKINRTTIERFQRMLGIVELPDFLLLAYFRVKKLVDKVDGVMSPCDLARIAMDCGFDPDTMCFPGLSTVTTTTGTSTMPPADFTPVDVPLDEDTPIAEAVSPTPEPITVPGEFTTPVALFTLGENVEILHEEELLQGKIVGLPSASKSTYTVLTEDDQTYEAEEHEIGEN